jgi:hypothetical protein
LIAEWRSARGLVLGLVLALGCGLALLSPPRVAAAGDPAAGEGLSRSPDAGASVSLESTTRVRHDSVTEGIDCSACHTPATWKSVTAASGSAAFDHSKTGFPLTARHREVVCASCHAGERRITRECAGCHENAHAGQLGATCDGCHSSASWVLTSAFAQHRQTRLPLTGMHALVDCRDCHQRTQDRAWTSVAADCFACHEADYRRADLHPPHVGIAGDPSTPPLSRDCADCHRALGWSPAFVSRALVTGGLALRSGEAHDRVFPLSFGPHRGAECASCHDSPVLPRAVRCTGCHAHDDARLRVQHRSVAAFTPSCLGCHPGGAVR